MKNIVYKARSLMKSQTEKNKAPAWLLTEIAIKKWKELSDKYDVNKNLVLISLYLAHTVFDPIWKWRIQKNHPNLSAKFSEEYLDKWWVNKKDKEIILNSIMAHHNKIEWKTKIAEVVKNAEWFKFLTLEWVLIFLHELWIRWVSYNEAVEKVLAKMEQKRILLTLDDCINEAKKNCKEIEKLFIKS